MIHEITDATIGKFITETHKPIIIDCWAEWCSPCKMLVPVLETLAIDYESRVKIGKLDVDSNSNTTLEYNVRNIPTLLFFKEGKLVDRLVGLQSKSALSAKLDELLK